ncbi:FMN-dependent NADH-azoreductase [Duganella violaceipulchra]|uniref:FMN dependent NADH:quinone oxidoreductase n=1 Tax=Duganella violaceipulchra TaxID=2849652 RepID=A0AA41L2C8_9BURK|nr:FMN-dependent NADH-azoreductase [Duganella violaceicalia]MBV6320079.1 FMN-dependent NADH-azoreductase [Duganella violaceicalia]MCP2010445.1 FMN-dependent NADH-azoreductase [Duganella violaceicalia]
MATVLHINSSVRQTGSLSRQLGGEFVAKWQAANPDGTVVTRDLASSPVPHLTEQMMGAYFTPAEQRNADQAHTIKTSDALVDELLAADTIVIGAPMYNFSVTSGLKAWIDHVARAGRTFKYGANGPEGLVHGKKVIVFVASGGVYSEGPAAAYDHVTTYLRSVLGFLGMTDVTFVVAEGVAMGEEAVAAAVAKGRSKIDAIAA